MPNAATFASLYQTGQNVQKAGIMHHLANVHGEKIKCDHCEFMEYVIYYVLYILMNPWVKWES